MRVLYNMILKKTLLDEFENASKNKNPEPSNFTQMVWKSTQKIGCAASCFEDKDFCFGLCVYYPAGNYEGEFEENVFPSL